MKYLVITMVVWPFLIPTLIQCWNLKIGSVYKCLDCIVNIWSLQKIILIASSNYKFIFVYNLENIYV